MAEISVVFLGGPFDGLEMVLANNPVEYRFAQMHAMPLLSAEPDDLSQSSQPLPPSYVAYRKTNRTVKGRRIYSLARD